MNKQALLEVLATASGLEKSAVEKIINALETTIINELKNNSEVVLTGFGTFSSKQRAARTGVNPRNPSEKIQINAVKVPKFKAGKTLKDALK
jgi:DNA-binding protein HU-beta